MKITTKTIIENAGYIPESLVRAVIRQSGGLASFLEKAPDISRHGISGGFGGWIYYSETEPFAKRHRADILNGAFTAAGVGIAYSPDGRVWVCVDFGG